MGWIINRDGQADYRREGKRMDNTKGHQIVRNFSTPAWFREWPNPTVPAVAAGVYVVWREGQLIYAGMSGRNIEKQQHRKKYGLVTRLESHAKGRLSGDQFNAYKNQSGEVKN